MCTNEMTINSKFEALRKQNGEQDKTVVVYIVGPPAYGKTQLARQFAEEYFEKHARRYLFRTLVVAAVDATSELSLYRAYKLLSDELNLHQKIHIPVSYSMEDGLLILARAIAAELKNRQRGWLLVLDNLTLQVKKNKNGQYNDNPCIHQAHKSF